MSILNDCAIKSGRLRQAVLYFPHPPFSLSENSLLKNSLTVEDATLALLASVDVFEVLAGAVRVLVVLG